jgi:hypothetical protein
MHPDRQQRAAATAEVCCRCALECGIYNRMEQKLILADVDIYTQLDST